ncbi:MAG: lysophospholipid acyltransferase family protein [Flavobacteriales bacterium]|nr:lysophospholipid acyltransferase family protein [Flavobacteriales bacterium]
MIEKIGFHIVKTLSRMPFGMLYAVSDVVAFTLYHIVGYRRGVVRGNIEKCFPEKTLKERKKIERDFYLGFTDTMLESLKMLTISPEEAKKRFYYENEEQLRGYLNNGHDHIMIFGHCSNWEWLMFTQLAFPNMNLVALYQKIENPEVNDMVRAARERFGMHTMEAKNALLGLSRLKNDGNSMVAFVADQSPMRHLIKHWVTFFGNITPAHIGAHDIATRLHFGVIFLQVKRVSRGHYKAIAKKIYSPEEKVEKYEIIDRFYVELERQLKQDPSCWLWSHRRWKYADEYFKKKNDERK